MKAIAGLKRKLSIFILLFLLADCSTAKKEATQEEVSTTEQTEEMPVVAESAETEPVVTPVEAPPEAAPAIPIVLIPDEIRPGEPFTVAFMAGGNGAAREFRALLLNSRGERLAKAAAFSLGEEAVGVLAATIAVPSTALPGEALIRIERDGVTLGEIPFHIADREFAAEEIELNQQNTDIRTVPDPKKTAESEQLWGIINSTGTEIFTAGPFAPPVTSTRRTSFYGDRRVYRYVTGKTDTAIHAGVDYGVPTGTPVFACADGRVVLARFRISTGNSVILEHLPGVYSIYYHMDSIQVTEGDMAGSGELLGESGSTGLATGPHLHWEIRVSGENADPDAFTLRPVLDKQTILSKLEELENP
ncbi:M23 family metallopeptidase [Treponema primitia]|uniref:M23 family metallopeptidase n=1 Tax=Treponema primitia TaxID=88058 RepID=UPI0002554F17|nr:M23 family metallopeptidase [Treponema primitia]